MDTSKLNIQYASDLDIALNKILEKALQEVSSGREKNFENVTMDIEYIRYKCFPDKGYSYTRDLCADLCDFKPRITMRVMDYDDGFRGIAPVNYLKDFLMSGGFSKIALKNTEDQNFQKQKELLNMEKLNYDLKNAKRVYKTYKYTFTMAIIGACISIILLILKLMGK